MAGTRYETAIREADTPRADGNSSGGGGGSDLARPVTITLAIASVFLAGWLLLIYAPDALLLTFAACWFGAVVYHASSFLSSKTGMPRGGATAVVVALLVTLLVGFLVLLVWQFSGQFSELFQSLQDAVTQLRERFKDHPLFGRFVGQSPTPAEAMQQLSAGPGGWSVRSLLLTPFGLVVNVLFIFFTGLYLAINPDLYAGGATRLFPIRRRAGVRRVLAESGEALWHWTLAQSVSMILVGLLSGIGLALLGVPMAMVLGLLTGLLTFIPNIGPILSLAPPMLLAFTVSPLMPLWVLLLYTGIQLVESYLITPVIQQQGNALPAALTIVSQLTLGVLFGILGVTFAMPISMVVMVLVRRFYVQHALEGENPATTDKPAAPE